MVEYIHNRPEWPAFRWDAERLEVHLSRARFLQGKLIGQMSNLGFALRQTAILETLTEDVLKSSEIEGEVFGKEQVRSSIARRLGVNIGALPPKDRAVEGVVEMMLDATQHFDKPLTAKRLFKWHRTLFPTGRSGLQEIQIGSWRDGSRGPMQIVSGPIGREHIHFEAPTAERLDEEMAAFLKWFNEENGIDSVVKSGIAHLWFVTIHPFDDGNGRIARAIADMTLARSERSPERFYSMSAQIRRQRKIYYTKLERTQKGELDVTPWLEWYLESLALAIEDAGQVFSAILKKARFWKKYGSKVLNERQRNMLNRLLDGFEGKLTSSKWAKIEKCSQDSALRDINDLVERDILSRDPGGGRNTSYSLKTVCS